MDRIDPERMRLRDFQIPAASPKSVRVFKRGKHDQFVKGPISWDWITMAARCPGKALHVAIGLLFWTGIKRKKEVPLSMTGLSVLGVSRFAASRGLLSLEKAGLVSVKRTDGSRPMVTVLEISQEPDKGGESQ